MKKLVVSVLLVVLAALSYFGVDAPAATKAAEVKPQCHTTALRARGLAVISADPSPTPGSLQVVGRRHGNPGVTPNNIVAVQYPPCTIGHSGWVSFESGYGSVTVKWTFGTFQGGDTSSTIPGFCQYTQGCLWYGTSPSEYDWYLKSAIVSGNGIVVDGKGCN